MSLHSAPLRSKLIAALLLPLLVVAGFLGASAADAFGQRDVAERQKAEVERFQAVVQFGEAIGDESIVINDGSQNSAALAAKRARVEELYKGLREPGLGLDEATLKSMQGIHNQLEALRGRLGGNVNTIRQKLQREIVAGNQGEPKTTPGDLILISTLFQNTLSGFEFDADAVADAQTAGLLADFSLVQRLRSNYAIETRNTLGVMPLPSTAITPFVTEYFRTSQANTDQSLAVLREQATPEVAASVKDLLAGSQATAYQANRETLDKIGIGQAPSGLDPKVVSTTGGYLNAQLKDIANGVIDKMNALAEKRLTDADRSVFVTVVFGSLLFGAVSLILFLLYRSIRKPLVDLTRRSNEIANTELPGVVTAMRRGDLDTVPHIEPMKATTKDELGQLVEAFNGMHHTAIELASEQAASRRVVADMFVNLGRRNQRLLNRMLGGLTDLERNEQDADTLAALYNVDHLATRMRRNAESLLVLAGAAQTRRWKESVGVYDVVRASLAEVEGYERVDILESSDIQVRGDYVADLTHLLAELIENALTFSPPTAPVQVFTRATARGVIIAVVDEGLGMTKDLLEQANARISSAATQDESPSEFLGHFVVGRLAARHDMIVELMDGVAGGLTARVVLPDAAIDTTAVVSAPDHEQVESVEEGQDETVQTPSGVPVSVPAEWALEHARGELDQAQAGTSQPLESPSIPLARASSSESHRSAQETAPARHKSTELPDLPAPDTTVFGSRRRKPGTHMPRTTLEAPADSRLADDDAGHPAPDVDDADSVRSSLSSFQSAIVRADTEE